MTRLINLRAVWQDNHTADESLEAIQEAVDKANANPAALKKGIGITTAELEALRETFIHANAHLNDLRKTIETEKKMGRPENTKIKKPGSLHKLRPFSSMGSQWMSTT
jgi:hypothetical protein